MGKIRMRDRLLYLAAVALVLWNMAPAFADSPTLGDFLAHSDSAIYVRGDYLKALAIVYQDFSKILKKHGSHAQDDQTEKRLSRIENYDIHIEQDADNYTIHVAPTLRDHGQEVFGGAFTYIVRRSTFQIVQVTPSK